MASIQVHIAQANHNENLATELANNLLQYRDWIITVSFYAAIHYVEAKLYQIPNVLHTDTSIPMHADGRSQYGFHGWRKFLINKHFHAAFKSFRKLDEASRIVRYLVDPSRQHLAIAGQQYFSEQETKNFLFICLKDVKSALGH